MVGHLREIQSFAKVYPIQCRVKILLRIILKFDFEDYEKFQKLRHKVLLNRDGHGCIDGVHCEDGR